MSTKSHPAMYQISKTSVNKAVNGILVLAIVISLLGIAIDFRNTLIHGGADLRNRIVGARLLSQGIDPYYYRWHPGDPETLQDPFDKLELPVSKVTVSPIGLAFYTPFANLSYRTQRFIWFVLQQLAFFSSLALLIFTTANIRNRAILAICLLVMNCNSPWRIHVETGQVYIFYVLIIALSYWFLSQEIRFKHEWSGLVLGLAIACRPPLIVIALPMLLFKKVRPFLMTLLCTGLWLLMSILLYGYQVWLNYFSAMSIISKLSLGQFKISNVKDLELPKVLEGTRFGFLDVSPIYETSLGLKLHKLLGFHLSGGHFLALIIVALMGYLLIVFQFYQSRKKARIPLTDILLMLGGVMVLIVDYWMPIRRNNYNDVFYLVALVPILKYIRWNNYLDILAICLLVVSLLMMGGLFLWIPFIMSSVQPLLALIAFTLASLLILKNSESP